MEMLHGARFESRVNPMLSILEPSPPPPRPPISSGVGLSCLAKLRMRSFLLRIAHFDGWIEDELHFRLHVIELIRFFH